MSDKPQPRPPRVEVLKAPAPYLSIDKRAFLQEVHALRAVSHGAATAEQQRLALKFIIEVVANIDDLSYRPGDTHDTAFAEGKRFVGTQIIRLVKTSLAGKASEQGD